MQTEQADELIDSEQLAARLGVTTRFVRRLVEERRIAFHKIGRFVRFHPDDVEAYVSERRVDTWSPRSRTTP